VHLVQVSGLLQVPARPDMAKKNLKSEDKIQESRRW